MGKTRTPRYVLHAREHWYRDDNHVAMLGKQVR
jgi:hypothetical protein